jgi:flagellar biosynthesis protein FliQ
MSPALLVEQAQHALLLALAVVLPVLAVAAVVGYAVASIQAALQVQDAVVAHLPRVLAVTAVLVLLGPWMGSQVAAYAERLVQLVPHWH